MVTLSESAPALHVIFPLAVLSPDPFWRCKCVWSLDLHPHLPHWRSIWLTSWRYGFFSLNWSLSKEQAYIDWISNAPCLTLFDSPSNCPAAVYLLCPITADMSTGSLLLSEPMRYTHSWTWYSDCWLQSQSTLQLLHIAIDPHRDPHPSLSYSYPARYACPCNELPSADHWLNQTPVGSRSWSLTQVNGWSTLRGPPTVI